LYKEGAQFIKPENENVTIWRYISFDKFKFLIEKRCLYFRRTDLLRNEFDAYEGSYVPYPVFRNGDKTGWDNIKDNMKFFDPSITVNCWHMNEYESLAMWRLYTERFMGIAVQSTFKALSESFHKCRDDVMISKIFYIDYEKDQFPQSSMDIFTPFLHKRKCFEHEKELRAFIWAAPGLKSKHDNGNVLAEVDINILIKKILIAPDSSDELYTNVNRFFNRYKLNKPVERSTIDNKPPY
jgi:hypothetical protein